METRKNWSFKSFVSLLLVVVMMTGIGGDSVIAIASAAQSGATQSEATQTPAGDPIVSVPGDTNEEGGEPTTAPEEENTPSPAPTQEPTAEPTATPEEESTPSPAPTQEPTAEPTATPTAEPTPVVDEVDYMLSLAERAEFTHGYVQVTGETLNLYKGATTQKAVATLGGYSVLYVTERDYENDRVFVVFNVEGNLKTGYVKTSGVRGLSPEEEAYIISRAQDEEGITYTYERNDNPEDNIEVLLGGVVNYALVQEEAPVATLQATPSEPMTLQGAIRPRAKYNEWEDLSPYDKAAEALKTSITDVSMRTSLSTVKTGESYMYYLDYTLASQPSFRYGTTDTYLLWPEYYDIKVSFTMPANVVLNMNKFVSHEATPSPDGKTIDYVGCLQVMSGAMIGSNTVVINAYLAGNGTLENGTTFPADEFDTKLKLTAKVEVEDIVAQTKKEMTTEKTGPAIPTVTSAASEDWVVGKVTDSSGATSSSGEFKDGKYILTYYIAAGAKGPQGIPVLTSDLYDREGRLDFTEYTVTDTYPTTVDLVTKTGGTVVQSGISVTPEKVVMTYDDGTTIATTTGTGTISTSAYKTNRITETPATKDLPFYTTYKVVVTYNARDFIKNFDDVISADGKDYKAEDLQFKFTNKTELSYKVVGQDTLYTPAESTEEINGIKILYPIGLTITKMITNGGKEYNYNSTYWPLFGGSDTSKAQAVFTIRGTDNPTPNIYTYNATTKKYEKYDGVLSIGPESPLVGNSITNPTQTKGSNSLKLYVFEDEYFITETEVPHYTTKGTADVANPVVITTAAKTVTFKNPAAGIGFLDFQMAYEEMKSATETIVKEPTSTTTLNGVTFALYQDAACTQAAVIPGQTGENKNILTSVTNEVYGRVYAQLYSGTYYIKQTNRLKGYEDNTSLPALKVIIEDGKVSTISTGESATSWKDAWVAKEPIASDDFEAKNRGKIIQRSKDAWAQFTFTLKYAKEDPDNAGKAIFVDAPMLPTSNYNPAFRVYIHSSSANAGGTYTSSSYSGLSITATEADKRVMGTRIVLELTNGAKNYFNVYQSSLPGSYFQEDPYKGRFAHNDAATNGTIATGSVVEFSLFNVYRGYTNIRKGTYEFEPNTSGVFNGASSTLKASTPSMMRKVTMNLFRRNLRNNDTYSLVTYYEARPDANVGYTYGLDVYSKITGEAPNYIYYYWSEVNNAAYKLVDGTHTDDLTSPSWPSGLSAYKGYISKPIALTPFYTAASGSGIGTSAVQSGLYTEFKNLGQYNLIDVYKIDEEGNRVTGSSQAEVGLIKATDLERYKADPARFPAGDWVKFSLSNLTDATLIKTTTLDRTSPLKIWVPSGDYYLVETSAPTGYSIADPVAISFPEISSIDDITAENAADHYKEIKLQDIRLQDLRVYMNVIDELIDDDARKAYAGKEATYYLYTKNEDGTLSKDYKTAIKAAGAEFAQFTGLSPNKEYYLQAFKVAEGYLAPGQAPELFDSLSSELNIVKKTIYNESVEKHFFGPITMEDRALEPADGDTRPETVQNYDAWVYPNTTSFSVIKQSLSGKRLGNAEFKLSAYYVDKNGNRKEITEGALADRLKDEKLVSSDPYAEKEEDRGDGTFTVEDLPMYYKDADGLYSAISYVLTETTPPQDYILPANPNTSLTKPLPPHYTYTKADGVIAQDALEMNIINTELNIGISINKWLRQDWTYYSNTMDENGKGKNPYDYPNGPSYIPYGGTATEGEDRVTDVKFALYEYDSGDSSFKFVSEKSPFYMDDRYVPAFWNKDELDKNKTYYVAEVSTPYYYPAGGGYNFYDQSTEYSEKYVDLPADYKTAMTKEKLVSGGYYYKEFKWEFTDEGDLKDGVPAYQFDAYFNHGHWTRLKVRKMANDDLGNPTDEALGGAEFVVYKASSLTYDNTDDWAEMMASMSSAEEDNADIDIKTGEAVSSTLTYGDVYWIEETKAPQFYYPYIVVNGQAINKLVIYLAEDHKYSEGQIAQIKASIINYYANRTEGGPKTYLANHIDVKTYPHNAVTSGAQIYDFRNQPWPPGDSTNARISFELTKLLRTEVKEDGTEKFKPLSDITFDINAHYKDDTSVTIASIVTGMDYIPGATTDLRVMGQARYNIYIGNSLADPYFLILQPQDGLGTPTTAHLKSMLEKMSVGDKVDGSLYTLEKTAEADDGVVGRLVANLSLVEANIPWSNVVPKKEDPLPMTLIIEINADGSRNKPYIKEDYYSEGNEIINISANGQRALIRIYGYTRKQSLIPASGLSATEIDQWLDEKIPTADRTGLNGVVFCVEKKNAETGTWEVYRERLVTSYGSATLSGLENGEYRLIETAGHQNYENVHDAVADAYYFTINNFPLTANLFNPAYPQVRIEKYDRYGDAKMEDQEPEYDGAPTTSVSKFLNTFFTLTSEDTTVDEVKARIDETGAWQDYLRALGKWSISEASTVNGYAYRESYVDTTSLNFDPKDLSKWPADNIFEVKAYNPRNVSVRLRKIDEEKKTPLNGAEFQLYFMHFRAEDYADADKKIIKANLTPPSLEDYPFVSDGSGAWTKASTKKKTAGSGTVTWDNLRPGWYLALETKAPTGYNRTLDVQIVAAPGDLVNTPGDDSIDPSKVVRTHEFAEPYTNAPDARIQLKKKYEQRHGAASYPNETEFTIYILDEDGVLQPYKGDSWESTTIKVETGVGEGQSAELFAPSGVSYYIIEKNYDGWVHVSPDIVTIQGARYRKVDVEYNEGKLTTIEFTNVFWETDVLLKKTNTKGEPLANTVFRAYTLDENNKKHYIVEEIDNGEGDMHMEPVEYVSDEKGEIRVTYTFSHSDDAYNGVVLYIEEIRTSDPSYALPENPITSFTVYPGQQVSYETEVAGEDGSKKLTMANEKGIVINVLKYANLKSEIMFLSPAEKEAMLLPGAVFYLYKVFMEDGTPSGKVEYVGEAMTNEQGIATFDSLAAPKDGNFVYAVYEAPFDANSPYAGFTLYSVDDKNGMETQSDSFTINSKETQMFLLADALRNDNVYNYTAYNLPTAQLTIRKYKTGSSTADAPEASFDIYKLKEVVSGDETKYYFGDKVNGDVPITTSGSGEFTSAVVEALEPGWYVAVETASEWPLIKDDSRIEALKTFEVKEGQNDTRVEFYNADTSIIDPKPVKATDPEGYEISPSLLYERSEDEGKETVTFVIGGLGGTTGTRTSNDVPYTEFKVTENGLSFYNDEDKLLNATIYAKNHYSFDTITVGAAKYVNYVKACTTYAQGETVSAVKAKVILREYGANGIEGAPGVYTTVLDLENGAVTLDVQKMLQDDYNKTEKVFIASFSVEYFDPNMQAAITISESGAPKYAVGQQFGADNIIAVATIEPQPQGPTMEAVASIKNNIQLDYNYRQYGKTADVPDLEAEIVLDEDKNPENSDNVVTIDDNPANPDSPTYEAVVPVDPPKDLPTITVKKTSEKVGSGDTVIGDTVEYTIKVTNLGHETIPNLSLTDPVVIDKLPGGVEMIMDAYDNNTSAYSITYPMRDGVPTLERDMSKLGEAVSGGDKYVALWFKGDLMQGDSITIKLQVRITQTVLEYQNKVQNVVYVTTAEPGVTYNDNQGGGNFKGKDGVQKYPSLDDMFFADETNSNGYVTDDDTIILQSSGSSVVSKFVSANKTNGWVKPDGNIADTSYLGVGNTASASLGGGIRYKLSYANISTLDSAKGVRFLDVLPRVGDGKSEWTPEFNSVSGVYKVNAAGVSTKLSATTQYTVYYSSVELAPEQVPTLENIVHKKGTTEAETATAIGNAPYNFTTAKPATVRAIVIILKDTVQVAKDETVYATIEMTAPTSVASMETYYKLAFNNITATAEAVKGSFMRSHSPTANVQVALLPADVSVGGRIWIDKDADGKQDDADANDSVDALPQNVRVTLNMYNLKGENVGSKTTTTNASGEYRFDGLTASRQEVDTTLYDDGVLNPSALIKFGMTYRLVIDAPAGYSVTQAYVDSAEDGKKSLDPQTSGIMNTNGSQTPNRANAVANDSNFTPTTTQSADKLASGTLGRHQSEEFFLWPVATYDYTKDIGLLRDRSFTIKKVDNRGAAIENATFEIHGPYTAAVTGGTTLSSKIGETITIGADGTGTLKDSADKTIVQPFFRYYVLVETGAGDAMYKMDGATVSYSAGSLTPIAGGVKIGTTTYPSAWLLAEGTQSEYNALSGSGAVANVNPTVTNPFKANSLVITKKRNSTAEPTLGGAKYTITPKTGSDGHAWNTYIANLEELNAAQLAAAGVSAINVDLEGIKTTSVTTVETSATDGKVTVVNLPQGSYDVEETVAPVGYVRSSVPSEAKKTAVITDGDSATSLTFKNDKIHLEIKKVSEIGATPISGVQFHVYKTGVDGIFDTLPLTNASGMTTSIDTTAIYGVGHYVIYEAAIPTGFTAPNSPALETGKGYKVGEFVVVADQMEHSYQLTAASTVDTGYTKYQGAQTIVAGTPKMVAVNRIATGSLEITKTDSLGNVVKDAVFTLEMTDTGDAAKMAAWTAYRNFVKAKLADSTSDTATTQTWSGANADTVNFTNIGIKDAEGFVQSNGTVLRVKTDADGKVNLVGLPLGNYKLTEVSAPYGYQIPTTTWTGEITADGGKITQAIVNSILVGNLKITKQETGKASVKLGGAQYIITHVTSSDDDGAMWKRYITDLKKKGASDLSALGIDSVQDGSGTPAWSIRTLETAAADGVVTVTGLPIGAYSVLESKAPSGYVRKTTEAANRQSATITTGATTEKTFENRKITLTINKVSEIGKDSAPIKVDDVVFKIYKKNAAAADVWDTLTTVGGTATTTSILEVGEYEVYESTPYLDNYVLQPGLSETTGKGVKVATFSVTEDQTGDEYKLTQTPALAVDGYYTVARTVAEVTTAAAGNAIVNKLATGAMLLTKTDENDEPVGDVVFTLEMTSAGNADAFAQYKKFIHENVSTTANKYENTNAKTINDTVIGITDSKGYVYSDGTTLKVKTDADGLVSLAGLPLGTYKLTEVEVPYGIVLPDADVATTNFNITAGTAVTPVSIRNYIIDGTITIVKRDADDTDASPIKLSGAVYQISHVAEGADTGLLWGQHIRMLAKKTSDELAAYGIASVNASGKTITTLPTTGVDGEIVITELPIGKYSILETTAPVGYVREETVTANTKTSVLTAASLANTVTYKNKKIYVEILKLSETEKLSGNDSSPKPVAGVQFTIYPENSDTAVDPALAVTDAYGKTKSTAIFAPGTYEIYETLPSGYVWHADASTNLDTTKGMLVAKFTVTADQTDWAYQISKAPEQTNSYYHVTKNVATVAASKATDAAVSTAIVNKIATGNLSLTKTDTNGNPVANAEFRLDMTSGDADAFAQYIRFVNSQLTPTAGTWSTSTATSVNGTVIGITGAKGSVQATSTVLKIKTDADGLVALTGLPLGTYTLTETAVPYGYGLISGVAGTATISAQDATLTYNITNEFVTGELHIGKKSDDPKDLGIKFEISVSDWDDTPPIILGRSGRAAGDKWTVNAAGSVSANTNGAGAEFLVKQTVNGVDTTSDPWAAYLADLSTSPRIYVDTTADSTGRTLRVIADGNGKVDLTGLPLGTYTVTEDRAPMAHALVAAHGDSSLTATVVIGQSAQVSGSSLTWGLSITDPFIYLKLTKIDSDGVAVQNAVFKLLEGSTSGTVATYKDGVEIVLTTDNNGEAMTAAKAMDLKPDTDYYLVETTTPYGYETVEEHKVSKEDLAAMRKDTEIRYNVSTTTKNKYPSGHKSLVDTIKTGSISITKEPDPNTMSMDMSGTGLQPAQFELKLSGNTAVSTAWAKYIAKLNKTISPSKGSIVRDTTDTSGKTWIITVDKTTADFKLSDIPYGTYTVKEIAAPTGYALPTGGDARTIIIGDTQTSPERKPDWSLTFTDKYIRFSLEKIDENGKPVEKAQFKLVNASGADLAGSTMTTDTDGKANTLNTWLPLIPGTYTLMEKVPYGYYVKGETAAEWVKAKDANDQDITFTITRTQTVYEYLMTGLTTADTAGTDYMPKVKNILSRGDLKIATIDNRNEKAITTFTGTSYNKAEYILTNVSTVATDAFDFFVKDLAAAARTRADKATVIRQTKGTMTLGPTDNDGKITTIRLYTDENGEIAINGLPFGAYTLEEMASSTGYALDDPNLTRSFVIGTANATDVLLADETYYNTPYEVQLYKAADIEDKMNIVFPVAGAQFEIRTSATAADDDKSTSLRDKDGDLIVLTSANDGWATTATGEIVLPLLIGTEYYLVETLVPDMFKMMHKPEDVPFDIANRQVAKYLIDYSKESDGTVMHYDYAKIENELVAIPLALEKRDAQDNAPLADAEFKLTGTSSLAGAWEAFVASYPETANVKKGSDGKSLIATTPNSGRVDFGYIPLGTYTVTETRAPLGYAMDTASQTITLQQSSNFSGEMMVFEDTRLQIVIEKHNNHGATLAGAMFEVRTKADDPSTVVAGTQITTGENGVGRTSGVLKLEPGVDYYLVETYVPSYHDDSFEPYKFRVERTWTEYRIDFSSVVGTSTTRIALDEDAIVNNISLGEIQVIKRSSVDQKLLSGAEFTLRQVSAAAPEAKIETRTEKTDANGKIRFKNLPYGLYILTETKAPAGYEADGKTWTFFVGVRSASSDSFSAYGTAEEAAKNATHTLTAYNTPVQNGSLRIRKIDGRDGYALKGAVFTLTGTGYDGTKVDLTGTTDENGYVLFEDLPGGTYLLTETQTPSEEYLPVKYNVTITSNHVLEVTIPNWTADDDGVLGARYEYELELEEMGVLPVTGEDLPIGLFAGIGGGVALLGALLLIAKRRRQKAKNA